MAKQLLVYSLVLVCLGYVIALDANCPLSSKMISCSPKCKDDTECFGRKCCPNICNTKSCVPANQKDNNDGYKGQNSKSGTGTYCGNSKCNSYEKCDVKKQRCVRS